MASLDKGTDPSKLTEGGGTDLKPRDFFWDSVIIYLVSVILALSAVDALTEFIRGTGVSCFTREGTGTEDFVNDLCAGSLPITEFIPAYIFIHGLAIAIPHFLWLATYGGQFDYFFSVVNTLDSSRDLSSGKFSKQNQNSVRQLEVAFTTYDRNSIYWFYLGKLALQMVFAVASLVSTVMYFTDFDVIFPCPRDINDTNTTSFPLVNQVTCVFTSLKLLFWIRIADIALLVLMVLSVFWAFLFCLIGHPTELGAKQVAQFSFQSGIQPNFYVPSRWYCPRCLSHIFVRFFSLPFNSPRICTDLDFLLLKLFHTNAGLGSVFKDIQIELHMQDYTNSDVLRLNLHKQKHDGNGQIEFNESNPKVSDLKWKFPLNEEGSPSTTFDRMKKWIHKVPNSVRGFVLGVSSRAETNTGGLSISFGDTGFGLALARVFPRVGSINFTHFKKDVKDATVAKDVAKQLITVEQLSSVSVVSVTAPDDIVVGQYSAQLLDRIDKIWFMKDGRRIETHRTSFIVVGPINSEEQGSLVSVFLKMIEEDRVHAKCVLLSLRPVKIEGRDTSDEFYEWTPPESYKIRPLNLRVVEGILEWPQPPGIVLNVQTLPLFCGSLVVEFEARLYARGMDGQNWVSCFF